MTYPAVTYTWSPNGQVTEVAKGTSPNQSNLSNVTVLEQANILYDVLGRRAQASIVSGGTTTMTLSQWTWDNANHLICAATRMNPASFGSEPTSACLMGTSGSFGTDKITYQTYDAADELTKVTIGYLSPAQADYATLTYTPNGLVQTVADARNNLTTNVYDNFDRVAQVQFPSPTTPGTSNPSDYEGFAWDANGNLTSDRRRSGETITIAYDALNRPIQKTFPSAFAGEDAWFCYDLLNRPLTAQLTASALCGTVPSASVVFAWDALSRLTSETTGGRTLAYAYDAAGDRTGITWPDTGANALTATYGFDVLQRMTTIAANGSQIAAYGYDSLGRRQAITRNGGHGAATAYGWDGADRLTTLTQSLTGGAAVTFTLGYDPSNGLVSRQVSNGAYSFHTGAASTTYAANGLNQLTTITPGGTSTYDGRGNNLLEAASGFPFGYSLENQLIAADTPTLALAYDAAGRIQTKTASGTATTFLYSGDMLVGDYNSSGAILSRYIPGPGTDEAALWYSGPGVATPQWLHADPQGSTIAWSNTTARRSEPWPTIPLASPAPGAARATPTLAS